MSDSDARPLVRVRLESVVFKAGDLVVGPVDLDLHPGEVCEIRSDHPAICRAFLRILASLDPPLSGRMLLDGTPVSTSDYRHSLSVKKRIAYMAADAVLISRLTLEQNLLLQQSWEENRVGLPLPKATRHLCVLFGIEGKLGMWPESVGPLTRRVVLAVRELAKHPELILMERPHDIVGAARREALMTYLEMGSNQSPPILFWTDTPHVKTSWVNRVLTMEPHGVREEICHGT